MSTVNWTVYLSFHTQLENMDSIHHMGKSCVCTASSTTQGTSKNQASRTQTQLSHPSLIHHFEVCKIDHKGPGSMTCWYCWWKNSGDHQLRLVSYPIICMVSYIPAGLLGSLNHQQYSLSFPTLPQKKVSKPQTKDTSTSHLPTSPVSRETPKNISPTSKVPFQELRWFLPTENGDSELYHIQY